MNGGWIKWTAEGRPTEKAASAPPTGRFAAHPQPRWVATADEVVAAIDKPATKIVDARTQAEIDGKDLRNIRRGGFVPSSVPVYWEDLLDPQTRTSKSADALRHTYGSRGILPSQLVGRLERPGLRIEQIFPVHRHR